MVLRKQPEEASLTRDAPCSFVASKRGMSELDLPGPGRDLIEVRDALVVPAHETDAAVLGHHDDERIVQVLAEAIGRSMARPDLVGALGDSLCSLQVEASIDGIDLAQGPRYLRAEAEDLELTGHDDRAVDVGETGNEVSDLE